MTARTVREYRKQAQRYLVPALGRLAIDEVKRRHIEGMADPAAHSAQPGAGAGQQDLQVFRGPGALRRQYDNPCRGVERSREEPRDRTLHPDRDRRSRQGVV